MIRKKYPLIICLSIFFISCSIPGELKKISKNELIFGSGGGFTGISNDYILDFDGKIMKWDGIKKESIPIKKISKQYAKNLYRKFLNYGLDTIEYSAPGNIYYYVGFKNDTLSHKIIWGKDIEPHPKAKLLYTELITLIN